MRRIILFLGMGLILGATAQALVESSYLQWQENGTSVPNSADVRVYARVLKTGCTGMCDSTECADLNEWLFFRAQGATSYDSLAMQLNIGDCYTPEDEYFADIPFSALSGDSVFFTCEFSDIDGTAAFTARPGSEEHTFTRASPAAYVVVPATALDFTLHVTGDFHCIAPDGSGPGISGTFNGWNYQAMTNTGNGIYTYDIFLPAGSATTLQFKFRNGTNWETLPGGPFANREYAIAPGATEDSYSGIWSEQVICPCIEAPLVNNQTVLFAVDMSNQDPASYSGGVSLQGSRAPLTWNAGTRLMLDLNHDLIYTASVVFPAGTINSTEFKFTRSNGTVWSWESVPNRFLCLLDNGFMSMVGDPPIWDDYVPPTGTTVPVDVTFQVALGCMGDVMGVSLQGGAAPLDWTAGSTPLTDADSDGIWEGTVTFPAGTLYDVEYKFAHTMDGSTWVWEDNILNRVVTLSDATPVVTLDPVLFDEFLCAPALDITYAAGQANLSWTAVPLAVSYNVYSAVPGYPTPATLEANTAGTTYSLPATAQKCFVVTAVK